MREELYKIVFKGVIGFGYDEEEVKENLQKFCGFDQITVDRLFSGGAFVLKKNLDEMKAKSLCDALQKLGAFTDVAPMERVASAAAPRNGEPPVFPALQGPASCVCPACGHRQESGDSCNVCGIFFAKFARVQERKAQEWLQPPGFQGSMMAEEPIEAGGMSFFVRIAAQPFTVQCGLLILGLAGLQALLGPGLLSTGFIILPVIYLLFIMVRAILTEQETMSGLAEHFNVLWERAAPEECRQQWIPWCTYGIILLDMLLYYGLASQIGPSILRDNLAFIPAEPNFWNVPLSAIVAPFLHSVGSQLWVGVISLWAVGPLVEKRLGRGHFLGLYLLTGILVSGAGALLCPLSLLGPLHCLGSSGAIAGLLGFIIARSADRSMEFSPPLLDLLPYFAPFRLTIRLDSLAFIGLFSYAGLGSGIDPQGGTAAILVGHLVNIVGMLTGLAVGAVTNPESLPGDDEKQKGGIGGMPAA
jgi:membrane associated rhomboid family serine protease